MTKTKAAVGAAQMPNEGIVEGYAATFDRIPDSYGDVIKQGAFADSLAEWSEKGMPIPLLYGHNTEDPALNIGKVIEAHEDERGLFVRAEFDADNEKAQYVRKLVQEGRLYQFSFAYEILDASNVELEDGRSAYELRRLNLFEVSLVQIPANQRAVVTGVKSEPQTIELRPRIEGLNDEQRAEFTKAIAEATHNGLEIGLKAGRRNSKADADELRRVLELADQITTTVRGLLADELDDTEEPDANAEEPAEANAEERKDAEALAQLLDVADKLLNNSKEVVA